MSRCFPFTSAFLLLLPAPAAAQDAAAPSIPEGDGQDILIKLKEDAFFDGDTVRYLDGQQTELSLISYL